MSTAARPTHGLDRLHAGQVREVLRDPERLRVLDLTGLVDSEPEQHLDRWTQVTAEALGAPVALISLVDDRRQFFKSIFGLKGQAAVERGMPVANSVCPYVVAAGSPAAVDDARLLVSPDGNALIGDLLGVVAYAGAPIVVHGQTVGTLCVTDAEARSWTAAELRLLDKLAQGLAYEIQLRIAAFELERGSRLVEAHNRIHELIADDQPLADILGAVVLSIETHDPELLASIRLLDPVERTLHHASGPHLPSWFLAAIDGIGIGPAVGSCGTAAFLGEEIISEDIALDARWDGYRHLTTPLGLRHCWSFPVIGSGGDVLGTVGVYGAEPRSPSERDQRFLRDAAKLAGIAIERRRSHDRLVFEATHDALTGLLNRAVAFDRLDGILARSARTQEPVAVMFVDLDRLKAINDSLGHHVGDQVIQRSARRLLACTAPDDLVARLGGEEFVIVSVGDRDHAVELAQCALTALKAPLADLPDGQDITVTGSIGVALITDGQIDARQAIRRADTAMYDAKSRGGDQYALRACKDPDAPSRRLAIESALRHAIEREQLSVVFQPLRRFASGKEHTVEALLRWAHPDLGTVPPDEFIPIAEQTGLINDIGAWVLQTACAALPALGVDYGEQVQLGINVSAQQLRDPGLPGLVKNTLTAHGLGTDRLYIEITETALLASDDTTERTVRELDAMGVHVALDDFGTGYSSLAVLKRYPIRAIKIDRSFINGLADDRDDLAIVTGLIRIGQSLGLTTVAEGVETQAQYDVLRELGCDFGQGYCIGRPVPAEGRRRGPSG